MKEIKTLVFVFTCVGVYVFTCVDVWMCVCVSTISEYQRTWAAHFSPVQCSAGIYIYIYIVYMISQVSVFSPSLPTECNTIVADRDL